MRRIGFARHPKSPDQLLAEDAGSTAKSMAREYLTNIDGEHTDASSGCVEYDNLSVWVLACKTPGLLKLLNSQIANTVNAWAVEHRDQLGGQRAIKNPDGSWKIDRGDGQGEVPLDVQGGD